VIARFPHGCDRPVDNNLQATIVAVSTVFLTISISVMLNPISDTGPMPMISEIGSEVQIPG
tara:strand:- start:3498 stop:3680 length:183 start_codon:yes stop_codon:yes gene_type:complete